MHSRLRDVTALTLIALGCLATGIGFLALLFTAWPLAAMLGGLIAVGSGYLLGSWDPDQDTTRPRSEAQHRGEG